MPGSSTLAGLLREQSRIRGDHPLLVRDSERIGYAEADRLSARLARGLIALGAGKGTHVGLLYPNGVPFVVGMLAAARIGAVVVPFSTFATGPEMHQQLVDSDVEIVLAAASYRSHDYTQRFEEMPPALEAEKPTMTNGFAASIAHLARHPSFEARDLSSMRRGNLYPIMAPDARPADPELRHNMLGMTEAGSVVLLSGDETDQPQHRRGSFGKPAPGFQTKVVDLDSGNPVGVGDVGELCLREPYVMQRYYKRSREECFDADGWFHTPGISSAPTATGFTISSAGAVR